MINQLAGLETLMEDSSYRLNFDLGKVVHIQSSIYLPEYNNINFKIYCIPCFTSNQRCSLSNSITDIVSV